MDVLREEEPREWISFEDPDELRTWMIDATFLRSNYKCIYGEGCKGVHDDPTPELMQGCCSFGAHFLDEDDRKSVARYVKRLKPRHWKNHAVAATKGYHIPGSVAREAQGFPNAPNIPSFPSTLLKRDVQYNEVTEYRFSVAP